MNEKRPAIDDELDLSNLGGTMPAGWRALLNKYGSSGQPMVVEAEIKVFMLLADLRVRHRLAEQAAAEANARAEASRKQAQALNLATYILAGATISLVIATVILIYVTATAD